MTTIGLEVYAQIVARLALRRGATVPEVMSELGLAPGDLARDEPALRKQLGDALARRYSPVATSFLVALRAELQRLGPIPVDGSSGDDASAELAPPAIAGAAPARAQEVPSFLHDDRIAPVSMPVALPRPVETPGSIVTPPPRAPAFLASTAIAPTLEAVKALPFVGAPMPPGSGNVVEAPKPSPAPKASVDSGTVLASEPAQAVKVPAGIPDLTPQQYASLRAELEPANTGAILERYRLTKAADRAVLDAHWRERFDADPVLRMSFARAYGEYVAWLRTHKP